MATVFGEFKAIPRLIYSFPGGIDGHIAEPCVGDADVLLASFDQMKSCNSDWIRFNVQRSQVFPSLALDSFHSFCILSGEF